MCGRRAWRTCLPLIALAVGGCADTLTPEGLVATFDVHPDIVRAGDSVSASITVHNITGDSLTISSGTGCMAFLRAYRDLRRVIVKGSNYGCLTYGWAIPIGPRDSVTEVHGLVALLLEEKAPWTYVVPPAPGVYTLQAVMNIPFPDMQTHFVVMP